MTTNGGGLTQGWALGLALTLLLATATFLGKATITNGREISVLQANYTARAEEMSNLRQDVREINRKLDRLLELNR